MMQLKTRMFFVGFTATQEMHPHNGPVTVAEVSSVNVDGVEA